MSLCIIYYVYFYNLTFELQFSAIAFYTYLFI